MLTDTQLRPPRVIRRWKTRNNDTRPKKVRDYERQVTLEQIHGTAYHSCESGTCSHHGVISGTYIKVTGPRREFKYKRFIPEVHLFHLECLPSELREARKLFE